MQLTEKFMGFFDIVGFKSLMARADAGNGMTHAELFDIVKLLGSEKDRAELDMQTLVWAKGRRFPIGRLGSRLMCPRCGSRDVNVIFEPPPTAMRVAAR